MVRSMGESGVRLTEVIAALSMVTDLGLGQPAEHVLRSSRIGMRLADRLGLDQAQRATLYDVNLLTYVGCPVYGNESAAVFGDDIALRAGTYDVDLATFPAMVFMLRRAGSSGTVFHRVSNTVTFMATGGRAVVEQMANHCSAAGVLAQRLGLGSDVQAGIEQSYARWDGKGVPGGLAGDQLSLSARVSHLADACEVLLRTGGLEHTRDVVAARRGTHFDPAMVDAVLADTEALFDGVDDDTYEEVLDAEPVERPVLSDEQLDDALAAIGDFCDLRCPCFAGHARGTALLVEGAAQIMGLPAAEATMVRRAAFVHDVGRFGVPGSVWDQAGPLSTRDQERMRMHVYYVERIFSRPEPLRRIGLLAATHHERMDGSGYHRGIGGAMLSVPARVLAAADAYHAMLQPRPHREASSAEAAARQLRAETDEGRFDPIAVDAVLEAAGHAASRSRSGGPAGLTTRETEVLTLLATGRTNKAIARDLGISPKTVGNHVEHIYTKLDVTNRAGAAMFAMQHGLVDA